ncbi:MAG: DUF4395 domain-containing protein [Comamonadaceae bacterium]
MTHSTFQFGERRPEFAVPVLNERAVRASAGILFFFAFISFMNAFLLGNFQPTRLFVVVFLVDFTIRIFINPRYAPSLIVGQWVVRKQQAEYVGAPQKRFAWVIGFVLALAMLCLMVLNNVIGPINMIVCSVCLLLLFFEAAFGICIGCKVYNLLNKEQAQLCPGGVCDVPKADRRGLSLVQVVVLLLFAALIAFTAQWVYGTGSPPMRSTPSATAPSASGARDPAEEERCKVPEFAKVMGHEEKWKQHNNCQ